MRDVIVDGRDQQVLQVRERARAAEAASVVLKPYLGVGASLIERAFEQGQHVAARRTLSGTGLTERRDLSHERRPIDQVLRAGAR